MGNQPYIEAIEITMQFPGTLALDSINFQACRGEVVAIVGENGAGKSTLMKIFSGVNKKTAGELLIEGKPVKFESPSDAIQQGITMIYQELNNLPKLTVAENIFLGRLPMKGKLGIVDFKKLFADTQAIFDQFGIDINVRAKIQSLSVAEKQFVEIIKAITTQDTKIVIMDEPTSSLSSGEIVRLFNIINQLKKNNVGIIYISHRLDEVTDIADRVVVFRDGKNQGELVKGNFDEEKIVSLMIGHTLVKQKREKVQRSELIYEIKNLNIKGRISNFNTKLYKGEILGIAGLMGSGKDELVKCLFGLWPAASKEIYFNGEKIDTKSPRKVLRKGIAYLPEERKLQSLFLKMTLRSNIAAAWIFNRKQAEKMIADFSEKELAGYFIKKLSIKTPNDQQQIINLSGGNQQKAVISRLLAIKPKILILNDPTRGIDVGSKDEIYKLIIELAEEGSSIVIVSSELEEICMLSNRVIILSKGEICGEFIDDEVNMNNILPCAVRMKQK